MSENEIKDAMAATASQALVVGMTAAAAMGPAGVPLTLFLGVTNGLLVVFTSDYEQPAVLTPDDLKRAVDQIEDAIKEDSLRQDARNASSDIKKAYGYYHDINTRAVGGENFTEADLSEIHNQISDALGPNSELGSALSLLENPGIGKFAAVEYALGANVQVKFRFFDIAIQANRGERIAPAQFHILEREASKAAEVLQLLIREGDVYMRGKLDEWVQSITKGRPNSGYDPKYWQAERDRLFGELYGGMSAFDDLSSSRLSLMQIATNAGRIASDLERLP